MKIQVAFYIDQMILIIQRMNWVNATWLKKKKHLHFIIKVPEWRCQSRTVLKTRLKHESLLSLKKKKKKSILGTEKNSIVSGGRVSQYIATSIFFHTPINNTPSDFTTQVMQEQQWACCIVSYCASDGPAAHSILPTLWLRDSKEDGSTHDFIFAQR